MATARVRADYEQLERSAHAFSQQAEICQQTLQKLQRSKDRLQGGDWIGRGATAFYTEMDSAILPIFKRLAAALEQASSATSKIIAIMKQTEQDVAALFSTTTDATPPASRIDNEPALPKWLTDLLEGIFAGDFSENSSLLKLLAQIGVGFIPIAGQIADVRDIIANIKNVIEGKEMAWMGLGLAVVAVIPGLDALKGGKVLKPILKALGDKGSREVVEFLLKNPDEVGRVGKTLITLADHPQVIEALAKNSDVALRLIREGTPEAMEAVIKHGDEAIKVIGRYGDDGIYIAKNFERYQALALDPAHIGQISEKTLRESGVGLALESQGRLPGPITRYPTPAAEFTDASGQAWDVKTFNSGFPPEKGGFAVEKSLKEIQSEIGKNENIILDTKDMTPDHIQQLRDAISQAGLNGKVIWFP